ncbi:hypothetical protein [Agrococcus baldri]|uniref:DUF3558 domain-containing protein n=1 Tax=Agrococcus baldri TaxID=153730 RepID=A0AA87RAS8_9MICO|nr:hypothetical protein [Agrococcus baldri]GEK79654.1 hypothetical protein ABA31_10050 [Agrococcus baldri]
MPSTIPTGSARPRAAWLCAIAASAVLLSGCASATAEPAEPAPQPSHTMPDGTVMSGAEHAEHADGAEHGDGGEHHASDGEGPSAAAEMVCGGQVATAAASMLGLEGTPEPSSSWDAPMFTCTYEVDGAPIVLTVHDVTDADEGQQHFDELQASLGAEEIEGMLGLGLPSFSTGDGVVGFLRDGKTLTVDATALPDGFADGSMTQDGAAYALASAVLVCWVEHD